MGLEKDVKDKALQSSVSNVVACHSFFPDRDTILNRTSTLSSQIQSRPRQRKVAVYFESVTNANLLTGNPIICSADWLGG